MVSRLFKNVSLAAAAAVVVAFSVGSIVSAKAANAAKTENFSKFEIQQIIHDYIMENPQLILEAVDGLQKKGQRAQQGKALGANKDVLFKDATSPAVGAADADVLIAEFMDYNCHYCKDALPTIKALLEKDKKVRFIFKDLPILGPSSETAAKWALAAQKQKKYFEYHSALMNNKAPLNDALLEKMAKDVGMDAEQAKKDVAGPEIAAQLDKNRALAAEIGVNGTPAFIIGDEVVPGAMNIDAMTKRVADYRAKKAQK